MLMVPTFVPIGLAAIAGAAEGAFGGAVAVGLVAAGLVVVCPAAGSVWARAIRERPSTTAAKRANLLIIGSLDSFGFFGNVDASNSPGSIEPIASQPTRPTPKRA